MMLEIKELCVSYGAIKALKGIDVTLTEGEIVALIGGNGAGKSTTLNTISGLLRPVSGGIRFLDDEITSVPPQEIVSRGIIHVPEGRRIFSSLTVEENLEMGAYLQRDKAAKQRDLEEVFVRFPRLKERRRQAGGTLSGGEQQMLAIARAIMAHPKLLLLDEPSMGLSPVFVEQIFDIIQSINDQGTSILLVEQNAQMALSIADRGYVLETGRIVLSGASDDLLHDPLVIKAYLGG
ncbi:amino acid/amide ABC transporter ATP-binding protein 2, HAAT family [Longilinea arvoryzae]|uniref:Amino acid/amide ABC transporter ATP-binding protein 2, HAAT family n=1 Tax=Longilinea arvoryzae TaxID=360412 RepID=A0A0S7BB39_9CHLR|nr:amino acid/amide ABC transporter ATP-binding protein 2, HAAT family [Longilinea arvoryzae]